MKKSKFSEEQIAYALREVESGRPPADVCRQLGVSEATFYIWKKKYAHLGVSELRQLRSLEDANGRLKRLVADLSLDEHILTEALRQKSEARTTPRAGRLGQRGTPVSKAGVEIRVFWAATTRQLSPRFSTTSFILVLTPSGLAASLSVVSMRITFGASSRTLRISMCTTRSLSAPVKTRVVIAAICS